MPNLGVNGEPGVPVRAPAILAATGQRLRPLPPDLGGVKGV